MKLGIIVYSKSGNTLSVAKTMQETLMAQGHDAELVSLEVKGEIRPDDKSVTFTNMPNLDQYEGLVFGSPVHAFSLSMPMKSFLDQAQDLKGKKAAVFVTQHLPKWMGGTRSLGAMAKRSESKGATVVAAGIVRWKNPEMRVQQIQSTVEAISKAFKPIGE